MSNARWTTGQACRPQDLELFFPIGKGGRYGDPGRDDAAKAICARCDIRTLCLVKALEEEAGGGERFGIRGGLNEDERAELAENGAA
jgi:WhiB family transcriptional regulator, redox-sensing transcriptional regulator